MQYIEAATILTKTAIENKLLTFKSSASTSDEIEKVNQFNAKEIQKLYASIYAEIKKQDINN